MGAPDDEDRTVMDRGKVPMGAAAEDEATRIEAFHPDVPSVPTAINPIDVLLDSASQPALPKATVMERRPAAVPLVTAPGAPPHLTPANVSGSVAVTEPRPLVVEDESTRLAPQRPRPRAKAGPPLNRRPVARRAAAVIQRLTGEIRIVTGEVKVPAARRRRSLAIVALVGLLFVVALAQLAFAVVADRPEVARPLKGQRGADAQGLFDRLFRW